MDIKLQATKLNGHVSQIKADTTSDETVLLNTINPTPKHKKTSKNNITMYICGYLTPQQQIVHSVVGFVLIWCIYGASYYTFNLSNYPQQYSIMTSTFSFLGSWDSERNPKGWYWFTIGMVLSFFVEIPLLMYVYQRLKHVDLKLAKVSLVFWFMGVCAQFLVGCFPDANSIIFGKTKFSDIHNIVAIATFLSLLVSAPINGALVAYDRPGSCKKIGKKNMLNHRHTDICIGLVITSICISVIFSILWQVVYPIMYAKDPSIGSNWSAAMNTIWSFPLWENVVIFTLYLYLIWFPFTLPRRTDGICPKQRLSTSFKKISLTQIQLKTQLSRTWFQILNSKKVNVRNAANLLEHISDCEEVEDLLSYQAVVVLTIIAEMINNNQNSAEVKKTLKEFTKNSNELWNWEQTLKQCIK
ncbi:DUF998_domain-containing protein [Hexamita inflata]|uniref:DUF998 domain-containing protein n=1 Tax=Hexamita inflata TaxID=28002 RepID=A0AA86RQ04_9EUKA|nr:DUF998 domain-containing protein [Hexamita inflata]